MLQEGFNILSKMNLKYVIVIVALCLAILFLGMDKCGSSRKADELKGEYKKASEIAKAERIVKEEIIKEQNKKIVVLNTTIGKLNTTIAEKEESDAGLSDDVRNLELSYDTLNDKDEKITNLVRQVTIWKEKFTLSQSIIRDKDAIIFSLTEKYEAQVIISDSYKTMYDTLTLNMKTVQKIVTAQDWQIKKLRLTSNLKTGIVGILAIAVIYGLVK